MQRFLFLLLTAWAVTTFFACDITGSDDDDDDNGPVIGSGNVTTDVRTVGFFDGIEVSSAIDLTVEFAPVASVEVRADDNVLARVRTEVDDDDLEIFIDGSTTNVTVEVTVNTPVLTDFDASGATNTRITGFASLPELDIEVSGASQLVVTDSDCVELDLEVSGASTVDLFGLPAREAEIDVSGASTVDLNVSQEIEGEVSGASTVRYRGNPTTDVEVRGTSTFAPE